MDCLCNTYKNVANYFLNFRVPVSGEAASIFLTSARNQSVLLVDFLYCPKPIKQREYIPGTAIAQQTSTKLHALYCRARTAVQNRGNMVSGGQSPQPFQRKRWTKASNLERRELQRPQQNTFTLYGWQRLAWQTGHQLQLHFTGGIVPPNSLRGLFNNNHIIFIKNHAFPFPLHRLQIRFINSILNICSPHSFPSSRARLTGNHPEHLGRGSSRWTLQPLGGRCARGSPLCCEDFSTHQPLQGLICGRGGARGGADRGGGAQFFHPSFKRVAEAWNRNYGHIHQMSARHHLDLMSNRQTGSNLWFKCDN